MTPIAATTAGWPTRKKLAPSRQEDAPHQQPLSAFTALHETFQVFPWPQPNRTSVFAQYTLRVQDHDALQAQARLQAAGIPTAIQPGAPQRTAGIRPPVLPGLHPDRPADGTRADEPANATRSDCRQPTWHC